METLSSMHESLGSVPDIVKTLRSTITSSKLFQNGWSCYPVCTLCLSVLCPWWVTVHLCRHPPAMRSSRLSPCLLAFPPRLSLGLFLVAPQLSGIILPLYGVCHDFPSVAVTPWLTERLEQYQSPWTFQVWGLSGLLVPNKEEESAVGP